MTMSIRKLSPRNQPVQQRARQRREQILQVTAELLEQVGLDDLTTILVAKRLGTSVGTLYHYFPNKHAILYALAERWLEEMSANLKGLEGEDMESLTLKSFVDIAIDRMLEVYKNQQGLLPLVQAMFGIPELRALDEQHDKMIIDSMARQLTRLGITDKKDELERLGREWLELTHALLLVVVNQRKSRADKTLADLKYLTLCLLERAKSQF